VSEFELGTTAGLRGSGVCTRGSTVKTIGGLINTGARTAAKEGERGDLPREREERAGGAGKRAGDRRRDNRLTDASLPP